MDKPLPPLRPVLLLRLQFIECLLACYGSINRATIMDYFGLSQPQASLDLRMYQDLAPANMIYDLRAKTYVRNASFKRLWPAE